MKKSKVRNKGWTQDIKSVSVGEYLMLVPYWERALVTTDRIKLIIDPGPSFGAGDHPTTLMALEFIEMVRNALPKNAGFLDAGTGTGVLGIAAKLLGFGSVTAFDIDAVATIMAKRNFALNLDSADLADVNLFIGTSAALNARYHVVAANLAAPTLLRTHDELVALTGSFLVLSGISDELFQGVCDKYSRSLRLLERKQRDGWNSLLLRRELA